MTRRRLLAICLLLVFAVLSVGLAPVAKAQDALEQLPHRIYLPSITVRQGQIAAQPGPENTDNAISVSEFEQVEVELNEADIMAAASAGADSISESKLYKIENCVDGNPCYVHATLTEFFETSEEDDAGSAAVNAFTGTFVCRWNIDYAGTRLDTMQMNARAYFPGSTWTAPLTWQWGDQAGTRNAVWFATWSELSNVNVNPSWGVRSGTYATAWAQGRLTASIAGVAPFDRVLSQRLEVTKSKAVCRNGGY